MLVHLYARMLAHPHTSWAAKAVMPCQPPRPDQVRLLLMTFTTATMP